ncbi:major facilitator superfamily domain-containing protein [Phascolomyces articulosus]|uniref:Major facilitator superfamily domain-containing protein n=1 Tax=Phascolomyces articulosus TaxID=60185 RepID=A0AAD5PF19_9FUNG|nr:major facilitator superfamily domain-containing protein [Phascolomyces articulosus]
MTPAVPHHQNQDGHLSTHHQQPNNPDYKSHNNHSITREKEEEDTNSIHQQVTVTDEHSIKTETSSSHYNDDVDPPKEKQHRWYTNIWCLINNQQPTSDPRQWPLRKKIFVILIVAFAGFTSPLASSIYYPAIVPMQEYFETTDTLMNASLAIYIYCLAVFPLIWATFSDVFGRRPVYLISFLVAIVGMACSAISKNITMFILFRAISAIGSSSVLSMGAGTIGDVFEAHQRGRAFSYYLTGPMLGPAVGPIFGGYLNIGLGWQSIFWFLAILCVIIWFGILFLLPETLYRTPPSLPSSPSKTMVEREDHMQQQNDENVYISSSTANEHEIVTSGKKNKKQLKKTDHKKNSRQCHFINPVAALGLLRNKNIALTVLFLGTLFFVYFVLTTNFTRIYTTQYGFDSGTVGLFYIPIAGGSIISGVFGGRISDALYISRVAKLPPGTKPYPELRIGGWIFYASIFILLLAFTAFGWCVEKNVHFAYGLVCAFFVGLATGPPNIMMSTYLVDCFRDRSASVTACNNFTRYILSGTGSLVATDMQRSMGAGGLYTFCGALIFVFAGNVLIVRIKGLSWRDKHNNSTSRGIVVEESC